MLRCGVAGAILQLIKLQEAKNQVVTFEFFSQRNLNLALPKTTSVSLKFI